jgi:hypothetical protein
VLNKSKPRGERMRAIVDHWQHATIEGARIDAMTASAYVAVWDALNEKNRAHLDSLPLRKAINVVWKLVTTYKGA